jgi:hypothetical protein
MTRYIIVDLADGLTALELDPDVRAEDVAAAAGGTLVDEGPFDTMESATDAINNIEMAEDERDG